MKKYFKYLLASLAGFTLLFALVACSKPSIDGSWTSPTAAQDLYDEVLTEDMEDLFAYSEHTIEEILTGSEVNLSVKDDKAVFELALMVDAETFFTALKAEQEAAVQTELANMGINYDELSEDEKRELAAELASDEDIRELVKLAIEEMASQMGGTYDADKGQVSTIFFKADVNRSNETLEMTEVNSALENEYIVEGEAYQYSYKDGQLIIEGETDEDDMIFEKKK